MFFLEGGSGAPWGSEEAGLSSLKLKPIALSSAQLGWGGRRSWVTRLSLVALGSYSRRIQFSHCGLPLGGDGQGATEKGIAHAGLTGLDRMLQALIGIGLTGVNQGKVLAFTSLHCMSGEEPPGWERTVCTRTIKGRWRLT